MICWWFSQSLCWHEYWFDCLWYLWLYLSSEEWKKSCNKFNTIIIIIVDPENKNYKMLYLFQIIWIYLLSFGSGWGHQSLVWFEISIVIWSKVYFIELVTFNSFQNGQSHFKIKVTPLFWKWMMTYFCILSGNDSSLFTNLIFVKFIL